MPEQVKAFTLWPFEKNQVGIDWREPGDRVEVWFSPASLVERDGAMMVRVQDAVMPLFAWWCPVDNVEVETAAS